MSVTPPQSNAGCCDGLRWRRGLTILLGGLLACGLTLWVRSAYAIGIEGVLILALGGATVLALGIWTVFGSGLRGSARTKLITGASILTALVVAIFRFDHFEGDMLPVFGYRFSATKAQNLDAYLAARKKPAVELTQVASGKAPAEDGSFNAPAAEIPPADETVFPTDYPGFLGADRLAVVKGLKLSQDWATNPPKELWRHPVGLGWSAFAAVGERIVTQEQRHGDEAVVCYDLNTGNAQWEHVDQGVRFAETMGGDGPRATPLIHRGRVYALGATGILNCLDLVTGKPIWRRKILPDPAKQNIFWAMSGSPLAVDDAIVVSPGLPGRSLVAYDRTDGHELWAVGDDPAAYGSPQLTTLHGTKQILILNGEHLCAHEPSTGKMLWNYPWVTAGPQRINTTQPMTLADFGLNEPANAVFIASGYGHGCALLEIKKTGETWAAEKLWENLTMKAKMSNMVIYGNHVYGLDEGIMACVELASGKQTWKGGRYGHGQMLLVGDVILVQTEAGKVVLLAADPAKRRELASLPALSSRTWNNPILVGRKLIVRNDIEAACYELPVE